MKRENEGGDPRVVEALNELGIIYSLDGDGDFQFAFQLDDDRTQRGFIRSLTYEFLDTELREIFSIGLKSVGNFDARTANLLLKENEKKKIGAWSVISDAEENHLAIFTAKIAANAPPKELVGTILAVLNTADEMERRLVGLDDF